MTITIINGSPKPRESTSELLIKYLVPFINKNEIVTYNKPYLTDKQFEEINKSNVLIFVFPLYIDSIPTNLLQLLIKFEKRTLFSNDTMVYCIINNGFFEGKQNHVAFDQMKNWCKSVDLIWGQAIGLGAGEMLPFLKDIPLGHGPNKNIGKAFKELACNITSLSSGKDIFISPNWSRFLWKIQASLFVWYPRAKKNGLKKCDLFKQINSKSTDF